MAGVTNSWGLRNANPVMMMSVQLRDFSTTKREINLSCFPFSNKILNRPPNLMNTTRNLIKLSCRCSSSSTTSSEWDWARWNRHFSEMEDTDSTVSVLKLQLKNAVEKEDFQEAVKLKKAIEEATSRDTVAEIMSLLKNAIDEERFHDASKLCQDTGSNLVGWWLGCANNYDDPFGKIVRITPGVGRYVGKSYTPRQLITASPGTPLFEIFVVKDANQGYLLQVVYFKRSKGRLKESSSAASKSTEDPPSNSENSSAEEINGNEEDELEKNDEVKSVNIRDASEEGIKDVLNFLKDKIPGLKVKVMNIDISEEKAEDSDSVEQLMQENETEKINSAENSEDKADILDESHPEVIQLKGGPHKKHEIKSIARKLMTGAVSKNKEDTILKTELVRRPAEIMDVERDSFVLHVPKGNKDSDVGEIKVREVKMTAVAPKSLPNSEFVALDVAKALVSMENSQSPSKEEIAEILSDTYEIVKSAVHQAQKLNRLYGNTTFRRIITSNDDVDPFEGLFIGAFHPYGPELVQLRRKFGHWNSKEDKGDVEFFEYVEAVKLTGDLNVPAGQVIFRAKIGKGHRISSRGTYPNALGVVASYKGQGRTAKFGFNNPLWVDGALLQFKGKGRRASMKGADFGFLYAVPKQNYLVLFKRLKLPE